MGKNWAIAIGINQYDNLAPLQFAKRDAEGVRDFCLNEVGFETVYYFSDDSPPIATDHGPPIRSEPTYGVLSRFLRVRFEQPFLYPGDNFWFFFAGHGKRHRDRDYLMPMDADPGNIEGTAIPISYITERLRRCGADNVVLFLDACRNEGDRDGEGIGIETQQGVITLFSCSPSERSYEINELQQGTFTHALLQGLRIQGEGNCATVDRLYQHLRYRVPELNRRYNKPRQTPYTIAEPATKLHLILLPKQATLADVTILKNDALEAEAEGNWDLAEQLWIRVLTVSPADQQGIKAIKRIAMLSQGGAHSYPSVQTTSGSSSSRSSGRAPSPTKADSPLDQRSREVSSQSQVEPSQKTAPYAIPNFSFEIVKEAIKRITVQPQRITGLFSPVQSPSAASDQSRRVVLPPTKVNPLSDQGLSLTSPTLQGDTSQSASPLAISTFLFEILTVDAQGREINRRSTQAQYFTEELGDGVVLEMVSIPRGRFHMGAPQGEENSLDEERPQHTVMVKPFLIGKYTVTQAQWRSVATLPKINCKLNPDPSHFKGDNRPVERVSWHDAVEFCTRLSKKTGREYRLPSESEWEYACRAGTITPFHFGETIITDLANYDGSYTYGCGSEGVCRKQTTDVGSFPPNAFGLHDMHGNVQEWCLDYWHENYGGLFKTIDGSAWIQGGDFSYRVLRGGSWYDNPKDCRSAYRNKYAPDGVFNDIGFRVVCSSAWTL